MRGLWRKPSRTHRHEDSRNPPLAAYPCNWKYVLTQGHHLGDAAPLLALSASRPTTLHFSRPIFSIRSTLEANAIITDTYTTPILSAVLNYFSGVESIVLHSAAFLECPTHTGFFPSLRRVGIVFGRRYNGIEWNATETTLKLFTDRARFPSITHIRFYRPKRGRGSPDSALGSVDAVVGGTGYRA